MRRTASRPLRVAQLDADGSGLVQILSEQRRIVANRIEAERPCLRTLTNREPGLGDADFRDNPNVHRTISSMRQSTALPRIGMPMQVLRSSAHSTRRPQLHFDR